MRPVCTVVVDGLPSESTSSSYPGPVFVSDMSLLHALGPVQTWLGQELEKCGIDAMIYSRYILSLLLHDSYDYDLQEQVEGNMCHGIRVKMRGQLVGADSPFHLVGSRD